MQRIALPLPPTRCAVLPSRGQVPGEEKSGFPPRAFASQDSLIPLPSSVKYQLVVRMF